MHTPTTHSPTHPHLHAPTHVYEHPGQSLVGSILPSLVTGLLPVFAHQPVFAKRLMKLVTRFAQLLDALCYKTPELRNHDANYVKYRLGEGGPTAPQGKGADVGGLRSASSASASGSGSVADMVEPPKLPWLLSLLKTTALLAGRLAGTMVVGDGNCHDLVEAR